MEKIIILLTLILPLTIAELLGGSTPPLNFFQPLGILFGVLMYGCGNLLIREAKARWKLQWSVIFLAIAYGIIAEGLMTKALFNPFWGDLGNLVAYSFFGFYWAWAAKVFIFHATMSTLVPLLIIEFLFPKYKNKPLLKKKGLILAFLGLITVVLVGFRFMKSIEQEFFYPSLIWIIISTLSIITLIWLAYKFRNNKIQTKNKILSSWIFGILGFFAIFFVNMSINIVHSMTKSATAVLLAILVIIVLILLFMKYQIYNQNTTRKHFVNLIFGMILILVILTPFWEFAGQLGGDSTVGYTAVGAVALILLILWRKKVI